MTAKAAATAAPIVDLADLESALAEGVGSDRPIVPVTVDDWDGAGHPRTFLMRGMTGSQRDAWTGSQAVMKEKGASTANLLADFRSRLIVRTLSKADGTQLVPRDQRDRFAKLLGERSSSTIQTLFKVAQKLNGLDDDDVKEMTEELKADPSDDSGTS